MWPTALLGRSRVVAARAAALGAGRRPPRSQQPRPRLAMPALLHTSAPRGGDGEMSNFPGAHSKFVNQLDLINTTERTPQPCYRIIDHTGSVLNAAEMPEISDAELLRWYEVMNTLSQVDMLLYKAQRQGRISFYMTSYGEEATHVGSAAALQMEDTIYAQYRETGVLLYRGFTVEQLMDQCYSNERGHGKGRQMPVHYGSKEFNFHTISSPLGTQLPQAVGAAYAKKRRGEEAIAVCYFGDGAASEGDAHPAFNFSATLDCPIVFFCRNNGYAISTPTHEQYRGDGIASRAHAYGMDCIRVDGNDVFAVYNAVRAARESTLKHHRPVLVEAMTYRVGHHSTSDDSLAYRPEDEISGFSRDSPIVRLNHFLTAKGLWDETKEYDLNQRLQKEIREKFAAAEKVLKPALEDMFVDVYDEKPQSLVEQEQEMLAHLAKYPGEYKLDVHAKNQS